MYSKPHIIERDLANRKVKVKCWKCKMTFDVKATHSQLVAWESGQFVQNAFPELNKDDRELLISGTCPKCWDKLWGGE